MNRFFFALALLAPLGTAVEAAEDDRLLRIFDHCDADGDGSLAATELAGHPRLQAALRGADADGDGMIARAEYLAHLDRRRPGANAEPETVEAAESAPADAVRTVIVDGTERRYLLHRPPGHDPQAPTPVVVVFHGGGGNPRAMQGLCGLDDLADAEGFLVVYPFGSGPPGSTRLTWNAGTSGGYALRHAIDDVAFTAALLDDLATLHAIDEDRVYATGLSNGAMMTYRVADALADRFAAIAPVGGPMGLERCDPSSPVAVIHFHGTADRFAPFAGGVGKGTAEVQNRPRFNSVDHAMRNWIAANGCAETATVTPLPDTSEDGMHALRHRWGGGDAGTAVELIEIHGGGHTWPGRPAPAMLGPATTDFSANELMWAFFQNHPKGGAVEPGSRKPLDNGDPSRDAAGTGQLFESIHVPHLTDVREGLNGFALADVDGNGWIDLVTVTTPPFALDETWDEQTGAVARTREPRDRLRLLLNHGGFRFTDHPLTLHGSAATPEDLSQGWRGGQVPALADFDGDGFYDIFITRQVSMVGGRIREGYRPVGCSLFLSDGAFDRFADVSRGYGARGELAYNRQPSLGDVNGDGFIDIAIGADNILNAYEGFPRSALFVFRPHAGGFAGGRFEDIGGTELIPDFGGYHHDPARDKAGPNLTLRDIDNDGDLDLLQSTHVLVNGSYPHDLPHSPGTYRQGVFTWRNLLAETGTFRFEAARDNGLAISDRLRFDDALQRFVPVADNGAPGLAYLFTGDVDNDALLDVIAVDASDASFTPKPTDVGGRFWRNRGDFRFEEATEAAGLASLNHSYEQWYAFFDNEVPDALTRAVDLQRMRMAQRFERGVTQPGLPKQRPIDLRPYHADVLFADVDNDTHLDVVVLDRREPRLLEVRAILYRNRGDGRFEPLPTTVSGLDAGGIAGEAIDLDNDGLVDLIFSGDPDNSGKVTDPSRYEDKVYRNTGLHGARENHWLRLRFAGVPHGELLGTRIEIRAAGSDRLLGSRVVASNHSYKSSSAPEAHFGLGDHEVVDLRIVQLGGRETRIDGVTGDRYLACDLAAGTLAPVVIAAE